MIKNSLQFFSQFKNQSSRCYRFCSTLGNLSWRTHTCGELNSNYASEEVTLCGWKSFHRCDRFVILRDAYGYTQVIFKEDDHITKKFIDSLPLESVLQVKGVVQKRPFKDINKKMPTGEIEVQATDIRLLNASAIKTPITSKDIERVTENMKYKYRYLYLRKPSMQSILRTRSEVIMKMRKFLHDNHGFVDVETPTLFKRTPGGAKEFIVPTMFPGKFYSLPQSPQQFKQLLMIGGLDRYFQIARCYRNEGTKSDRQPEFTQVDIELSFTTVDHVQNLVESLLKYCWPEGKGSVKIPFPKMTYEEAMKTYGTDKPDLRFEVKIHDFTEDFKMSNLRIASNGFIASIAIPNGSKLIKKSLIKDLETLAQSQNIIFVPIFVKEDQCWSSSLSKHIETNLKNKIDQTLLSKPEDLILLAGGETKPTQTFLGKARLQCAEYLQSIRVNLIKPNELSFVWITDFPLFIKDNENNFECAHHPFTAPHPEDIDFVYTDPCKARSQHYDLVLNGQEIGGGSIRVHDALLQKYILEDILKENSSELQHLLDALSYGCPPHGGIALGIDRIIAIMCGCHSITEVIAFPKSLDGKDPMSGAPCPISFEDKSLYHIEPILSNLGDK